VPLAPSDTAAPSAAAIDTLLDRPYRTLRLAWVPELRLLRARSCVTPIPCYSLTALGELQTLLADIAARAPLVRHFVLSSDVPGIFNFGGDLALFVLLVRAGDVESL